MYSNVDIVVCFQITTHDTLETVYKKIPMECLPVEYLPDDYSGPNAGAFNDILSESYFQMCIRSKLSHILFIN